MFLATKYIASIYISPAVIIGHIVSYHINEGQGLISPVGGDHCLGP